MIINYLFLLIGILPSLFDADNKEPEKRAIQLSLYTFRQKGRFLYRRKIRPIDLTIMNVWNFQVYFIIHHLFFNFIAIRHLSDQHYKMFFNSNKRSNKNFHAKEDRYIMKQNIVSGQKG